jgi:hypothetical protein
LAKAARKVLKPKATSGIAFKKKDPTMYQCFNIEIGPLRVHFTAMFGVIANVYWKGEKVLFTSSMIRPKLNKLFEAIYGLLEFDEDDIEYLKMNLEEEDE